MTMPDRRNRKRPRISIARLLFSGLLLTACLWMASCRPKATLNESRPVPAPAWAFDDPIGFDAAVIDTSSRYDLTFSLKHTDDYPWMNAFFLITTVFPDMETRIDTLECILADPSGRWYGSRFGKYRSMGFLYKQGIRFPIPGEYHFEIRHAMRNDSLEDIVSVGLKIQASSYRP